MEATTHGPEVHLDNIIGRWWIEGILCIDAADEQRPRVLDSNGTLLDPGGVVQNALRHFPKGSTISITVRREDQ